MTQENNRLPKPILEVCAGDIESVRAACLGGASRIELCSALSEGGVTPSYGFIARAVEVATIPVNVLIRPRGGDFLYTPDEVDIMVDDIRAAVRLGVNAVVIGALDADGNIDIEATRRMVEAAEGKVKITFHRAFDLCRDPRQALEQLIELKCDRVLTSGTAASAIEGVETLAALNAQAAGRIAILAGAGVSAENAADIIRKSGVREVHASARSLRGSDMRFRHKGVSMGTPGSDEYSRAVTDPAIVRAIVDSISSL